MVSGLHVWLAILVLYLLESLRITTPSAVLFRRRVRGSGWVPVQPFEYPGTGRYSWVVRSLSPGAGRDFVSEEFLVAMDAQKIAPNTALSGSRSPAVSWDEIRSTSTTDRFVMVNGSNYLFCESAGHALAAKAQLDKLRAVPVRDREAALEACVRSAFASGANGAACEFSTPATMVRFFAAVLWLLLIVEFPLMLLFFRSDAAMLMVASACLVLDLAILVSVVRVRRRMHPGSGFPWFVVKYLFYPIAALRAADDATEGSAPERHPILFALESCEGEARDDLLRRIYLRVLYPVSRSIETEPDREAVSATWNRLVATHMETLLKANAPAVLKTLVPQVREDGARSWCPRCLIQYRHDEGICADCRGIALRGFKGAGK
jgi:hypothetical protein